MIEREISIARLSKCKKYRFTLTRYWGDGPRLVWVMLNPSTADADKDDATIRRVRGFTKREGFAGFIVVNVWAYRTTDPKRLIYDRDMGANHEYVLRETKNRDVVVAWGAGVRIMRRIDVAYKCTSRLLAGDRWALSVRCFGVTKSGEPRHPLMLKKDTPLIAWPLEDPSR